MFAFGEQVEVERRFVGENCCLVRPTFWTIYLIQLPQPPHLVYMFWWKLFHSLCLLHIAFRVHLHGHCAVKSRKSHAMHSISYTYRLEFIDAIVSHLNLLGSNFSAEERTELPSEPPTQYRFPSRAATPAELRRWDNAGTDCHRPTFATREKRKAIIWHAIKWYKLSAS